MTLGESRWLLYPSEGSYRRFQLCHPHIGKCDVDGGSQLLCVWNDQSAERTRNLWVTSPQFGVKGPKRILARRQLTDSRWVDAATRG